MQKSGLSSAVSGTFRVATSTFGHLKNILGDGPLAEEMELELKSLPEAEQSKAHAAAHEAEDVQKEGGALTALTARVQELSSKLQLALQSVKNLTDAVHSKGKALQDLDAKVKDVCATAKCVSDPDLENCKSVPPFSGVADWVRKQKFSERWVNVTIKVTVYPLVALVAKLKETAVFAMGPVGSVMDSGLQSFGTICEFYDVVSSAKDCFLPKVLRVTRFTLKVLKLINSRKWADAVRALPLPPSTHACTAALAGHA